MDNINESKLEHVWVFNESSERVASLFRKFNKFKSFLAAYVNSVTLRSLENWGETNSELEIKWKNGKDVILNIKGVSTMKECKQFEFLVTSGDNPTLSFKSVYSFYTDTLHHKTVLNIQIVYNNKLNREEFLTLQGGIGNQEIFAKLKDFLKSDLEGLYQEETISINDTAESVWKAVSDWSVLQKHVKHIQGDLKYEGEADEIGTKFHIQGEYFEYFEYYMQVANISISPFQSQITLHFYAGVPKSPKQNLIFIVRKIKEESSFLTFRHEFLQHVPYDQICKIVKEKQGILSQLKKSLESSLKGREK